MISYYNQFGNPKFNIIKLKVIFSYSILSFFILVKTIQIIIYRYFQNLGAKSDCKKINIIYRLKVIYIILT